MNTRGKTGKQGEELAQAYVRQYCSILAVNWKSGRYELDIIAEKNGQLFFIEVKTRTSDKFGYPEEAVNYKKEQHIRAAAVSYMEVHDLDPVAIRFDIIAIILHPDGSHSLCHLKDVC
ncbi:YraN family protein [Chitinophaga sp. sic0106]|uniref:YraN family protein n=1 Tax=Chitinophaga sp. sic0106 TaxID=2854785 RepID=UPI001C45AD41|nr:YraN family protein [Chitinophaga sp. sic0106]MBV7529936.1 YraN family protein [Chitinophaga sp. sic0106]